MLRRTLWRLNAAREVVERDGRRGRRWVGVSGSSAWGASSKSRTMTKKRKRAARVLIFSENHREAIGMTHTYMGVTVANIHNCKYRYKHALDSQQSVW